MPDSPIRPSASPAFTVIAGLHRQAALRHVAILGLPAIAVIDHRAVAAFAVVDALAAAFRDRHVLDPVADAQHLAVGRREHLHPGLLRRHGGKADIGAVMALIGQRSALVILRGGRRIAVDIMLDEAGPADLAGHRQAQGDVLRRSGAGEEEQAEEARKDAGA